MDAGEDSIPRSRLIHRTLLRGAFGSGWDVRGQLPVALDDDSEPEPDVSVVPGSFRDYRQAHPARAGGPDYWIVNLVDHVLEVYRDPAADPGAPYGWRYASVVTLRAGDAVIPLAALHSAVPVVDLVP